MASSLYYCNFIQLAALEVICSTVRCAGNFRLKKELQQQVKGKVQLVMAGRVQHTLVVVVDGFSIFHACVASYAFGYDLTVMCHRGSETEL